LKKLLIPLILLFLSFSARADAGYFVGLTFILDANATAKNVGFTAKMLNSDKHDEWKFAIGGSVYPWSENLFGIDVGAGYSSDNAAGILSYDLLQAKPAVSLGWVND
jgi:hypothetical protein